MFKTEKFEFDNRDGQTLVGRLELPYRPRGFAIFAHCFTCGKDAKAATRIGRGLAEAGIGVLRFDFTGLGNSEGDFANTNFSSNVDDLLAASEALASAYQPPQLLIGHSLGGTAALLAAAKLPGIRAVATIGSPASPSHVKHLFSESLDQLEDRPAINVKLGGRAFTIQKQFVDDLESIDMTTWLAKLGKPVLICHSPDDQIVGIEQAKGIYNALQHPKSFLSLDGADHLLLNGKDSAFVSQMLLSWMPRYLEVASDHERDRSLADGELVVTELEGLTQEVVTNRHRFLADEPANVGGEDLGMTPYDLLLASLGTCTSMTLRMYARHKGLELTGISVRLAHQRVHAKDCEDCESESGYISVIRKTITVSGTLSPEQVDRLKQIADRCPVHRTMMSEKKIETEIMYE